jgi:hypothetical protein
LASTSSQRQAQGLQSRLVPNVPIHPGEFRGGATEIGVEGQGPLVKRDGLGDFCRSVAKFELEAAQESFVSSGVVGTADDFCLTCAGHEPQFESTRDVFDDLVLEHEDFRPRTVETFGPDMATSRGVDQLRVDPHVFPRPARAALKDVPYAEFLRDLRGLRCLPLVNEGGVARHDEEAGHAGQRGGQILGNAVGEIALFLVVAQIVERQNDQRRSCVRHHSLRCDHGLRCQRLRSKPGADDGQSNCRNRCGPWPDTP